MERLIHHANSKHKNADVIILKSDKEDIKKESTAEDMEYSFILIKMELKQPQIHRHIIVYIYSVK